MIRFAASSLAALILVGFGGGYAVSRIARSQSIDEAVAPKMGAGTRVELEVVR